MKALFYLASAVLLIGCVDTNTSKTYTGYEGFAIKYGELEKKEEEKQLSDSTSLMDIKLLISKSEYEKKVKSLTAEKKLKKIGRDYVYVFKLMDGVLVIHGAIEPYFHNDILYKLKVKYEAKGSTAYISEVVLFSELSSLYNSKYTLPDYESLYFSEPSAYIYKLIWFGKGKIIELNGSDVTYYCASVEKEIYDAKKIKDSVNAKRIIKDI